MAVAIEVSIPEVIINVALTIPLVFAVVGCTRVREQAVIEPDVLRQLVVLIGLVGTYHVSKLSRITNEIGVCRSTLTVVDREHLSIPLAVVINNGKQHLLRQGRRRITNGQQHVARLFGRCRSARDRHPCLTSRQAIGGGMATATLAGQRDGIVQMVGKLALRQTDRHRGQPGIVGKERCCEGDRFTSNNVSLSNNVVSQSTLFWIRSRIVVLQRKTRVEAIRIYPLYTDDIITGVTYTNILDGRQFGISKRKR